jgi:hypothetical protein
MIIFSLVSLFIGVALGQHFKIRVVIPVSVVVLLFAVGTSATHAQSVWSITLTAVIVWITMQIGYFIGIAVHHVRSARSSSRASSLASHAASARR